MVRQHGKTNISLQWVKAALTSAPSRPPLLLVKTARRAETAQKGNDDDDDDDRDDDGGDAAQYFRARNAATPALIHLEIGWSVLSSMYSTKFVEWPVVRRVPFRETTL
mmetsp:Transcript_101976/g.195746  ORF Transcript_101976/g.195746 Transcript_101976/m.195746 type:complete len:108 (-) Transcript_101976:94-417(-)